MHITSNLQPREMSRYWAKYDRRLFWGYVVAVDWRKTAGPYLAIFVSSSSLSFVHFDDSVLIHVLEYVRRIQQYPDCSSSSHEEENVQLQAIYYHGNILPVFSDLRGEKAKWYSFKSYKEVHVHTKTILF